MTFGSDERFLFQEKTSAALVFIYRKEVTYISEVSSNIDSTFSHTNKIVKRLEEIGLLSSVFEGRSRFLQLTPRGYFLAKSLSDALDTFRSSDEFAFPEGYLPTRKEETEVADELFSLSDSSKSSNASDSETRHSVSSKFDSVNPSAGSAAPSIKTASGILFDRLRFFSSRVKELYDSLTETNTDADTILQKLEPYDRELKMIAGDIENLNPDDESLPELISAYRAAEMHYLFYLGR